MSEHVIRESLDETAVLVLAQIYGHQPHGSSRREESSGLVAALGCRLSAIVELNIREPSAAVLFGPGQLQSIHEIADTHTASLVIIDNALSPIQQRNLETRLGVKVIDRTALILEIFGLRARSSEGKLQVELARVTYERTRLVRTWTHLERQRGGLGAVSGPGETQLEADRRMLDRVVKRLSARLARVRRTRNTQRTGRGRRGVPVIALVGYTNAGKSTLFNRLTASNVLAKDMPFATLDPTIREFSIDGIGDVALVDTVGFITDLPTDLIDAFQATLEEAIEADLILHVRDTASESFVEQKIDVELVLSRLEEVSGKPRPPIIEVWNKADLLDAHVLANLVNAKAHADQSPMIIVSAELATGFDELDKAIAAELAQRAEVFRVVVRPEDGRLAAWLFQHGEVHDRQQQNDGSQIVEVTLSEIEAGRIRSEFPDLELSD